MMSGFALAGFAITAASGVATLEQQPVDLAARVLDSTALHVEESIVKQIVGHSNDSITYGRYGKGFPTPILKEVIDRLDFYGIDFIKLLK